SAGGTLALPHSRRTWRGELARRCRTPLCARRWTGLPRGRACPRGVAPFPFSIRPGRCREHVSNLFGQMLGREELAHASLLLVERLDLRFDPRKVASRAAIARAFGGWLDAFVELLRVEHGLLDHLEDFLLEELRGYLGVAAALDLASALR